MTFETLIKIAPSSLHSHTPQASMSTSLHPHLNLSKLTFLHYATSILLARNLIMRIVH